MLIYVSAVNFYIILVVQCLAFVAEFCFFLYDAPVHPSRRAEHHLLVCQCAVAQNGLYVKVGALIQYRHINTIFGSVSDVTVGP